MGCIIQLKLQLPVELEYTEEDKDFFFLSGQVNLYLLVYHYVSLLDVVMRKMGSRH